MYRLVVPALIVASLGLAACQSSSGGNAAGNGGVYKQETQEEAIRRIERQGAEDRRGRGP